MPSSMTRARRTDSFRVPYAIFRLLFPSKRDAQPLVNNSHKVFCLVLSGWHRSLYCTMTLELDRVAPPTVQFWPLPSVSFLKCVWFWFLRVWESPIAVGLTVRHAQLVNFCPAAKAKTLKTGSEPFLSHAKFLVHLQKHVTDFCFNCYLVLL